MDRALRLSSGQASDFISAAKLPILSRGNCRVYCVYKRGKKRSRESTESILSTLFAPDLHQKTSFLSGKGESTNNRAVPKLSGTAPSSKFPLLPGRNRTCDLADTGSVPIRYTFLVKKWRGKVGSAGFEPVVWWKKALFQHGYQKYY